MRIIHEFRKNGLEIVRVCLAEFMGTKTIDLRVCYKDESGNLRPTRKGLSLSLDSFPELLKGIEKAGAAIQGDKMESGLGSKVTTVS